MAVSRKSISDFRSKLSGGGARPNIFEVSVVFPFGANQAMAGIGFSDADFQDRFRFFCKTAALPASNISPIEIPFRGRTLKVAGDRTFDTWTITVINDSDFYVRNQFELWMNAIGMHQTHRGFAEPGAYMANAYVYQLGRQAPSGPTAGATAAGISTAGNEHILATYQFYDIFPTNLGQIDLSYDSTDSIEEFTVEFQVNWWEHQGNSFG
jgi:hypothetical protein